MDVKTLTRNFGTVSLEELLTDWRWLIDDAYSPLLTPWKTVSVTDTRSHPCLAARYQSRTSNHRTWPSTSVSLERFITRCTISRLVLP